MNQETSQIILGLMITCRNLAKELVPDDPRKQQIETQLQEVQAFINEHRSDHDFITRLSNQLPSNVHLPGR